MKRFLCYSLCLFLLSPVSYSQPPQDKWHLSPAVLELGGTFEALYPNQLPGFSEKIFALGVFFGLPLGNNSLIFETKYSNSFQRNHLQLESWYRLILPTPFFRGYLGLGTHLHYYDPGHLKFGGQTAIGMVLEVIKKVNLGLGMKLYIQDSLLVGLGSTITYQIQ